MSKHALRIVNSQRPTTFNISYAPDYRTFILHHIATDPSHPLHMAQRRQQAERRKEGLWWHVTTGTDLSKSNCVRTWARRRLRNALRHELQRRGYDEAGSLVDAAALQHRPDLLAVLRQGRSLHLRGSLRLHVQPPLIPAKYAVLCAETGQLIDNLLQVLRAETAGFASARTMGARPQSESFSAKPQQARAKGNFTTESQAAWRPRTTR